MKNLYLSEAPGARSPTFGAHPLREVPFFVI
nr:MAG TPA: hypothetical protein [Caudoviricetes sp.]